MTVNHAISLTVNTHANVWHVEGADVCTFNAVFHGYSVNFIQGVDQQIFCDPSWRYVTFSGRRCGFTKVT